MPNKVPATIEEFLAPWETKAADGTIEVGEIDTAKLKTLLFNALTGERTAQAELHTEKGKTASVQGELDKLKQKNETDEERRQRETKESTEKATADAERADKAELDKARLEVAIEKGLTVKQAARLSGKTKAELETDADEYIAENGLGASEGEGDGDQGVSSRSPVGQRPRIPNDPAPNSGSDSKPEDWAAEVNSDFIL